MPPHHEHWHGHVPPHALPIRNANKVKFLFFSFIFSTSFATAFAMLLRVQGISIEVIIPSSAPIWMGILTIGYMVQIEK